MQDPRVLRLAARSGCVAARPCDDPEPAMNLSRSAANVLSGHGTLEVECIDRMHLNVRTETTIKRHQ
jgi:hypothetical protein